jgi:hypothetical protein
LLQVQFDIGNHIELAGHVHWPVELEPTGEYVELGQEMVLLALVPGQYELAEQRAHPEVVIESP